MKPTYTLTNTFSNSVISRHHSVKAAVAARVKHTKAIRKRSAGSYTTYSITDTDGNPVSRDDIESAEAVIQNWK